MTISALTDVSARSKCSIQPKNKKAVVFVLVGIPHLPYTDGQI